jgi:hypothetical protein
VSTGRPSVTPRSWRTPSNWPFDWSAPVVGVFGGEAGGDVRRGTYAVGLLPLAAISVLIAGAAVGVPGMVPLLGATPVHNRRLVWPHRLAAP